MEQDKEQFIKRYRLPILMGLVGGVLLMSGVLSSGTIGKLFAASGSSVKYTKPSSPHLANLMVKVDVSGAVESPGVYSLDVESRVEDALRAAGGVTDQADPDYLAKTVDLAQKISDGMKIYIPKIGEVNSSSIAGISTSDLSSSVVNLNSASLADLDKLPGVGVVTAQNIFTGRPYASVEELLNRKIVSKSVYQKIKDLVSI